MPTDPMNQIAETLAESLYNVTTHVATHAGIAKLATTLADLPQSEQPQQDTLGTRVTSWLNPFPKFKKALMFLGLEGAAHLVKEPASETTQKMTPAAKQFLTPIVKKAIEPILHQLQEQGLLIVQDPVEAAKALQEQALKNAETAQKLQAAATAATQATQAAAEAMNTAAQAAAQSVKEVKEAAIEAQSWLPKWVPTPTLPDLKPDWLKYVDIFGVFEEEIPLPVPPSAAEQAAQQTKVLVEQAANLAQSATTKAKAAIELTKKAAETWGKSEETAAAARTFAKKVAQKAAQVGTEYVQENPQDSFLKEATQHSAKTINGLWQHMEKSAPRAGKLVADALEKGAQGYRYTTSVGGSLVENVGEALGVSNPVALGIIATAGILSYWGLKSSYHYMMSSTQVNVNSANTNTNSAVSQPIIHVHTGGAPTAAPALQSADPATHQSASQRPKRN